MNESVGQKDERSSSHPSTTVKEGKWKEGSEGPEGGLKQTLKLHLCLQVSFFCLCLKMVFGDKFKRESVFGVHACVRATCVRACVRDCVCV